MPLPLLLLKFLGPISLIPTLFAIPGFLRAAEAEPVAGQTRADYQAGFAPYREAISQVTLPPRGPRRAPQNIQRVQAIVTALSARKEALLRGA